MIARMADSDATTPARDEAEVIDAILDRIAGGESVTKACKAEAFGERTFWRRVRKSDSLRAEYVASIQARGLKHADEVIAILDEPPRTFVDDNGVERVDSAYVAHQRNRADGRKWDAGRMQPKLYGDKLELEAKVNVGDAIIDRLNRARSERAE